MVSGWKWCEVELPFAERTAQRLMAIAGNPVIANAAHASLLPPSWGTLYELTKLPSVQLEAKISDGSINPRLERRDVAALLPNARKISPGPPPASLPFQTHWKCCNRHGMRHLVESGNGLRMQMPLN